VPTTNHTRWVDPTGATVVVLDGATVLDAVVLDEVVTVADVPGADVVGASVVGASVVTTGVVGVDELDDVVERLAGDDPLPPQPTVAASRTRETAGTPHREARDVRMATSFPEGTFSVAPGCHRRKRRTSRGGGRSAWRRARCGRSTSGCRRTVGA
jgi:hypothetical protein